MNRFQDGNGRLTSARMNSACSWGARERWRGCALLMFLLQKLPQLMSLVEALYVAYLPAVWAGLARSVSIINIS